MSINSISELQKKVERFSGEKFTLFPGPLIRGQFYYPKREGNFNSTRYWLRFIRTEDSEQAVFGDWATLNKKYWKINFKVPVLSSKEPDIKDFKQKQLEFIETCKKLNLKKGWTSYLEEFQNLPPKCWTKNHTLFVPYKSGNTLKAMLKVYPSGKKMYVKGSEPQGAFCILKDKEEKDSLIYLCEGIKTAYACLKACPEHAGVWSVGSLSNMEHAVKEILERKQKPVLCAERSGYNHYVSLKSKYPKCLMVGSRSFDDMYHIYKELGFHLLKKNMTTFKQEIFIPIGMDEAGRIIIYIKYMKNVMNYGKEKLKELFCDCHNTNDPPSMPQATTFYWNTRFLCRLAGIVKYFLKIKEGVIPHRGNTYYYDTVNLYLLKNDKVKKIDPEAIISPEIVLCKEKNIDLPDLEPLTPLTDEQIEYIFSFISLFGFKKLDEKLLKGWIIQSIVCGGLPYRAPLWLIAPTGAGKSQLTSRLLKSFFIFYERKTGRQTTAKWIHRSFNGKAIPLQRDEYDPSKRYSGATVDEMECVRTCSTERFPERGISAGIDDSVQSFVYCFSALYTSTKKPLELSDPDMARFIFLTLKHKFPKGYNSEIKKFQNLMTLKMKSKLVKTCLESLSNIKKNYEKYMSVKEFSDRGHKKSSLLMLAACYNAIFKDKIKYEEVRPVLQKIKISSSRLLLSSLKLVLKKNHYNFSSSQILFNTLNNAEDRPFMEENGFFLYNKKKELLIHKKIGIRFLERLWKENSSIYSEQILISELESDGPFYIKTFTIGKLKEQIIRRGNYLAFNWTAIKKEFLG